MTCLGELAFFLEKIDASKLSFEWSYFLGSFKFIVICSSKFSFSLASFSCFSLNFLSFLVSCLTGSTFATFCFCSSLACSLSLLLLACFSANLSIELEIASAGWSPNINTRAIKPTPIEAITVPSNPIRFIRGAAIAVPSTPPPISIVPKVYACFKIESIDLEISILPLDTWKQLKTTSIKTSIHTNIKILGK